MYNLRFLEIFPVGASNQGDLKTNVTMCWGFDWVVAAENWHPSAAPDSRSTVIYGDLKESQLMPA